VNHAQLIALGRALRVAGEHGQRLDGVSSAPSTEEIRQDLERAFALLDEAVSTSKPTTRCAEHPNGPVDPDAFDGCLLCETRRRSGPLTPRHAAEAEDAQPIRTQSRHSIRADQPQPQKRWIPEMWNGQAWQLCGTPRQSEREAEQYLEQLRQGPNAAAAYRLVYAFTDHQVLRIWGTANLTPRRPSGL
jgi:hypothetical protein